MIAVSNADRVVFPEIGRTKGDVVRYYDHIAERMLPHLIGRPLSLRRYPKGLAAAGFFQKNVPAHYPASIGRHAVPRSAAATKKHARRGSDARNETVYPLVSEHEHLPYLANQGAIELHVPTFRVDTPSKPDRLVIDLDPPEGAVALVRRAAEIVRNALEEHGVPSVPVATGSKGYHVVAAIEPTLDFDVVSSLLHKLAVLLATEHPEELTTVFRVAQRGERLFLDWLRNNPNATVVAPYSLRARPRATVAVPLSWAELETTAPDRFCIDDVDLLLERPDSVAALALAPANAEPLVRAIDQKFVASGLELEVFDRFRS